MLRGIRLRARLVAVTALLSGLASTVGAEGVVVRGESLVLGAVAPTLSIDDGRILDLSALLGSPTSPPYSNSDLIVFDLETRVPRVGGDEVATLGLISQEGDATYLGALLDEPGDVLFFERAPASTGTLATAERFLLIDSLDGGQRYLSSPNTPVPEPSTAPALVLGSISLLALRRRRYATTEVR